MNREVISQIYSKGEKTFVKNGIAFIKGRGNI